MRVVKSYDLCLEQISNFLYGKNKKKWPDTKQIKDNYPEMMLLLNSEEKDLSVLCNIKQEMISLIELIRNVYFHIEGKKHKEINRISIKNTEEALEFYKKYIGYRSIEVFHILYLNSKLKLIKEETLFEGSVDNVHIEMRQLIKSVLFYNASSIILMHNHPSDDSTPSEEDIQLTHDIQLILRNFKVKVLDHIVVSKNKISSLKKLGHIY